MPCADKVLRLRGPVPLWEKSIRADRRQIAVAPCIAHPTAPPASGSAGEARRLRSGAGSRVCRCWRTWKDQGWRTYLQMLVGALKDSLLYPSVRASCLAFLTCLGLVACLLQSSTNVPGPLLARAAAVAMAEVGEKREGRRATSAAEVAADDEKAQQGLVSVTWSWNKDDVSEGSRKKEYFIYLESVPQCPSSSWFSSPSPIPSIFTSRHLPWMPSLHDTDGGTLSCPKCDIGIGQWGWSQASVPSGVSGSGIRRPVFAVNRKAVHGVPLPSERVSRDSTPRDTPRSDHDASTSTRPRDPKEARDGGHTEAKAEDMGIDLDLSDQVHESESEFLSPRRPSRRLGGPNS